MGLSEARELDLDTSEARWVQQACQGNAEGWERIVQAHQQPVFRLAYLLLGDPDDAADVAQETFIRAYRALLTFDTNRAMRPWLLRITANLAHNWQRRAGRYLTALQRLFHHELPPVPTSQHAEKRLEEDLLWEAVRGLRLPDQQIIYLRFYLELSESETAEVLNIPAGTVKSRLHRALARLRDLLQKNYPELAKESMDA